MPSGSIVLMVAAVAVGSAVWSYVALRRRKADLRQYLEPPLQKCGVDVVSSTAPGFLRIGPFPKLEFEVRPQSSVAGIQGSYDQTRIGKFRGADWQVH